MQAREISYTGSLLPIESAAIRLLLRPREAKNTSLCQHEIGKQLQWSQGRKSLHLPKTNNVDTTRYHQLFPGSNSHAATYRCCISRRSTEYASSFPYIPLSSRTWSVQAKPPLPFSPGPDELRKRRHGTTRDKTTPRFGDSVTGKFLDILVRVPT